MRPVELSEPGDKNNNLETEKFDVDSALSDLERMKYSESKDTTGVSPNSDVQNKGREKRSSESSKEEDEETEGGILSRLKSLF
ncbi:hypothetical protein [Halorubrum sp. Boch-26]|uniref:hypothetical protein n=1 Tax=Halorubrum sp. Boch-26 TaxID=2994426 RepID=UPI002469B324|nr:hypothetical protein [Halorubrum sp. Boch-26]